MGTQSPLSHMSWMPTKTQKNKKDKVVTTIVRIRNKRIARRRKIRYRLLQKQLFIPHLPRAISLRKKRSNVPIVKDPVMMNENV